MIYAHYDALPFPVTLSAAPLEKRLPVPVAAWGHRRRMRYWKSFSISLRFPIDYWPFRLWPLAPPSQFYDIIFTIICDKWVCHNYLMVKLMFASKTKWIVSKMLGEWNETKNRNEIKRGDQLNNHWLIDGIACLISLNANHIVVNR